MKIVKTARSAFERQVTEGVNIQTNRKDNFILTSKSEYNRRALPRLKAKVGNYTLDELEKKKWEEKEKEKTLIGKVRNLQVTRSLCRRKEET